jgi:transcriptional regulator with XRE-family HTH domain
MIHGSDTAHPIDAARYVGGEIRTARLDAGYSSIEAFAAASGLSPRVIGDLETGRRATFSPDTIARLETTLGWPHGEYESLTGAVQRTIDAGLIGIIESSGLPDPRELGAATRNSFEPGSGFQAVARLRCPTILAGGSQEIAIRLVIPDCAEAWLKHFRDELTRYTFTFHQEAGGETMWYFTTTIPPDIFDEAVAAFDNALEATNEWYRTVELPKHQYFERFRHRMLLKAQLPPGDEQAARKLIQLRARALTYLPSDGLRYVPKQFRCVENE